MDKIFKIGLLVLGFGYLAYLFCPVANQVGRYSLNTLGEKISVLDTTNADYYLFTVEGVRPKIIKVNPTTHEQSIVALDTW